MDKEALDPPMKMAKLVVGSATLYSRSKSSIHRHTMLVSLKKKAAQHEPANEQINHRNKSLKARSELMGRFRVTERSKRTRGAALNVVQPLAEDSEVPREQQPTQTYGERAAKRILLDQVHSQLFPHDVGPNQGLLVRLMERSVYGQDPKALNSEGAELVYAACDYALLHGLLSLSSLNLDLSTNKPASRMSLILRGRTIQSVRERLSDPAQSSTLGTVGAIATLAAFDLLETYDDDLRPAKNITFLEMAIKRNGGLKTFGRQAAEHCNQCYLMARTLTWLDCSNAILNDVALTYSIIDHPVFLPYNRPDVLTGQHHTSASPPHFRPLFIALSHLSNCIDHEVSQNADISAQKFLLGDEICAVEQHLVIMQFNDIPGYLVRLVRLASFLYVAKYVRMLPRRSRILTQLVSKMKKPALTASKYLHCNFSNLQTPVTADWAWYSQTAGSHLSQSAVEGTDVPKLLLFCTTVAWVEAQYSHTGPTSQLDHSSFGGSNCWTNLLSCFARVLQLDSITGALESLNSVIKATKTFRKDAARALEAAGLRG